VSSNPATARDSALPGLTADHPEPLLTRIRELGWLSPDEPIQRTAPAGEGNMNLTLRVVTDRQSLIVKHARPWVEKYPQVPAPAERIEKEWQFYRQVANLPEVASRMPRLVGFDAEARLLAVSDLGEAADLTDVYRGQALTEAELTAIADWAAALHEGTREKAYAAEPVLTNRTMRQLNHQHIFELPWQPGAVAAMGLELDQFEPGLTDAAAALQEQGDLAERARAMGRQYLADGPCLLHGDLFPGSFLRSESGIMAIDPEFAYCGEPAFDIGVWLAHLALAEQGAAAAETFLARYGESSGGETLDQAAIAGFAGCEVIRRLIGVAQLPIPASTDGRRAALLDRAAQALRTDNPHELFS
jgi:5-methylthioribose kinase